MSSKNSYICIDLSAKDFLGGDFNEKLKIVEEGIAWRFPKYEKTRPFVNQIYYHVWCDLEVPDLSSLQICAQIANNYFDLPKTNYCFRSLLGSTDLRNRG